MTRNEIKGYCFTLVKESHKGLDISQFEANKFTSRLTNEVWGWWKKLPTATKGDILSKKANPAEVYSVMKVNERRKAEWYALPIRKRIWIKLCQKLSWNKKRD